jgi:putative intracellular protease/amidase
VSHAGAVQIPARWLTTSTPSPSRSESQLVLSSRDDARPRATPHASRPRQVDAKEGSDRRREPDDGHHDALAGRLLGRRADTSVLRANRARHRGDDREPRWGQGRARPAVGPRDPSKWSANDLISVGFVNTPELTALLDGTPKVTDLDVDDFDALMIAGGLSPMWTFRDHEALKQKIVDFYEAEKPVAAYCHGTSALVDVKLSDGSYLVGGKTVTGFSNAEENYSDAFVGQKVMPWRVEDALRERGANYVQGGLFKAFTCATSAGHGAAAVLESQGDRGARQDARYLTSGGVDRARSSDNEGDQAPRAWNLRLRHETITTAIAPIWRSTRRGTCCPGPRATNSSGPSTGHRRFPRTSSLVSSRRRRRHRRMSSWVTT